MAVLETKILSLYEEASDLIGSEELTQAILSELDEKRAFKILNDIIEKAENGEL